MSEIDWSKAPEGATHYSPESISNHATFWQLDGERALQAWVFKRGGVIVNYSDPYITRDTRELLIKRPPAWTGECLPPVGTVCEWLSEQYGWLGGKVVGHDGNVTVVAHNDGYTGCHPHEIRPIRPPEQIAAEEREKAIDEMAEHSPLLDKTWSKKVCAALYDAGYRKVTP